MQHSWSNPVFWLQKQSIHTPSAQPPNQSSVQKSSRTLCWPTAQCGAFVFMERAWLLGWACTWFRCLNKHAHTWIIPGSHTSPTYVVETSESKTKKRYFSQSAVKTGKQSFGFHGNVMLICLCLRLPIQFKPVSVYQSDRSSLSSRSQNIIHVTSHHCVWERVLFFVHLWVFNNQSR